MEKRTLLCMKNFLGVALAKLELGSSILSTAESFI